MYDFEPEKLLRLAYEIFNIAIPLPFTKLFLI